MRPISYYHSLFSASRETIRGRLIGGVWWTGISSALSQGFSLIGYILLGRILAVEGYGEFGIIQSTLGAFVVFVGPCLGVTAMKYVAELRDTDKPRAGRIIAIALQAAFAMSAVLGVSVLLAAPFLAQHTLKAPYLTTELRLSALALFFTGINGALTGVLSGFESFRSIAVINLIRGFVFIPALVILTWYFGLIGAVGGLSLVEVVACLATGWAIRLEIRRFDIVIRHKEALSEVRILWSFAFPAMLSGIIVAPIIWIGNILLAHYPNGYHELGIFNAANNFRVAICFLPGVINRPFISVLTNLYGINDICNYRRVIKLNMWITLGSVLFPAVFVALFSPAIMHLYGESFIPGVNTLRILCLTAVMYSAATVSTQVIVSIGKMWHGFLFNGLWAVIFVVSFLNFLPSGSVGLAKAYALSYTIHFCVQSLYLFFVAKG